MSSPTNRLIQLALPICMVGLLNTLANLVAMLFVAKLGKVELAASGLAYPTFTTIVMIATASLYAVGILSSNSDAKEDFAGVRSIVSNGFWVALLLGIPSSIFLYNIARLLALTGQAPQLVELTIPYFHYAAFALVPSLLMSVLGQFYLGIGRPKVSLIITLMRLPLIIMLSYVYILGKFGFPKLGLAGVSCATLIVQIAFCIGVFLYIRIDKSIKKYGLLTYFPVVNWAICKNLLQVGIPIGLQFGAELAAMTAATYLMGLFGVMALDSAQIVAQYARLTVMITLGISQAVSVLISNAHGEQDLNLIHEYFSAAIRMISILCLIIMVLFLGFPRLLMQPYIDIHAAQNAPLIHLTQMLFAINGIRLSIDAIRNVLSGSLRGLRDSTTPMIIGIICLWGISLPMSYLFGYLLHGGPVWLRIGFLSGFLVAAILLWGKFSRRTHLAATVKPVLAEEAV